MRKMALMLGVVLMTACGGGGGADPAAKTPGAWWWDVTAFGASLDQTTNTHPDGWGNMDFSVDSGKTYCREYYNWTVYNVISDIDYYIKLTFTQPECGDQVGDIMGEHFFELKSTTPYTLSGLKLGHEKDNPPPYVAVRLCDSDWKVTKTGLNCTKDTAIGPPSKTPPAK
jgi:hypothetical protein